MPVCPIRDVVSPSEQLIKRALRLRRRGEARRAWVALREACAHDEESPRAWTLYGVSCVELGKRANAQEAFRQAIWLRRQAKQGRRVAVLEALMERYGLDRQCA